MFIHAEDFPPIIADPRSLVYNVTDNPLLLIQIVRASQIWALIVAVFGAFGNVTTIGSIIYQLKKHKCFRAYPQNVVHMRKLQRNISVETVNHSAPLRSVNTVSSFYEYENKLKGNKASRYFLDFGNPLKKGFSNGSLSSMASSNSENYCRYESGRGSLPIEHGSQTIPSARCSVYSEVVKTRVYFYKPIFACRGDTLLLLYLSFADLLYCVINLPITYHVYDLFLNGEVPNDTLCSASAFLRYTIAYAEWLTLGLLAVERCSDLKKSPKAKFFTFWPTTSLIGAIWIISIVAQLVPLFGNKFGYDYTTLKCDFLNNGDDGGRNYHKAFFFTIEAALPTLLMIFGFCSIFYQIWQNKRALVKAGVSTESVAKKCKEMWNFVAMTLGLLILYLVCVVPICIYAVVLMFSDSIPLHFGVIIFMFYWLQYAVNFIVYGIYNKNYRKAYKEFLRFVFRTICRTAGWDKSAVEEYKSPSNIYFTNESGRINPSFKVSNEQLSTTL